MNESHFTYRVDGAIQSKWAAEWSDIKAEFPTAILISQAS